MTQRLTLTFRLIMGLIMVVLISNLVSCGNPPQQATQEPFSYPVHVTAKDTGENLPGAKATITVSGLAPLQAETDVNGFARIQIDATYVGKAASLTVEADGFTRIPLYIDLFADRLPLEVRLERSVALTPDVEPSVILIPTAAPQVTQPAEVSQPTANGTSSSPVVERVYDDFNDDQIDRDKWVLSGNKTMIYEQNGVLNIRVTEAQSNIGEGAELLAIPFGRPVREISFTMAIESYKGEISVGGGLKVNMQNGSNHAVTVGHGKGDPGIEIALCSKEKCENYEDYTHPPVLYTSAGVRTPVRLAWTGDKVEVYFNKGLHAEIPANQIPITEVRFFFFTSEGGEFHLTVDDVYITYVTVK